MAFKSTSIFAYEHIHVLNLKSLEEDNACIHWPGGAHISVHFFSPFEGGRLFPVFLDTP